jgi:hypothetical protein
LAHHAIGQFNIDVGARREGGRPRRLLKCAMMEGSTKPVSGRSSEWAATRARVIFGWALEEGGGVQL